MSHYVNCYVFDEGRGVRAGVDQAPGAASV